MSGESQGTKMANWVTPPRAGLISVLAATAVAASQDLRLLGNQAVTPDMANLRGPAGLPGKYATFQADGADVYVIFGPTNASVTGGNAPVVATTGVNAAGACVRIPGGTSVDFLLHAGLDLFVGYITPSGTSNLRIFQSSDPL